MHSVDASRTTSTPPLAMPLATGLVVGLLLGVLTQVGQGALPDGVAPLLANSGGAWIIVAFAVGASMSNRQHAALVGATTLVVASFTYYEAVEVFEGFGSDHRSALIWAAAGLVTGPLFGVAGFAARHLPDLRPFAVALLSGALCAEAAHLRWWAGNDALSSAAAAELTLGLGLLVVAVRLAGPRRWYQAIAVAAVAWLATRLATETVDLVFSGV